MKKFRQLPHPPPPLEGVKVYKGVRCDWCHQERANGAASFDFIYQDRASLEANHKVHHGEGRQKLCPPTSSVSYQSLFPLGDRTKTPCKWEVC